MASKKMYVCTISVGVMVVAEDKEEAALIALNNMDEYVDQATIEPTDFIVSEARTHRGSHVYAEGWNDECLPYGFDDDEDMTVGEVFKDLDDNGWK